MLTQMHQVVAQAREFKATGFRSLPNKEAWTIVLSQSVEKNGRSLIAGLVNEKL